MQENFSQSVTIGNDIVDLQEKEPNLHPRYIQRVFSHEEQANFGSNISKMWLNWSAKEAAYKAISRIFPETIFSPLDFELISDELISFKNHILHHKFIINDRFAFSYCSSNKAVLESGKFINWISELPKQICSSNHSSKIREFVKDKLANFYGVPKSDLKIPVRNSKNEAPKILIADQKIDAKLSFSHHGKLLACSFLDLQ